MIQFRKLLAWFILGATFLIGGCVEPAFFITIAVLSAVAWALFEVG